MDPGALANTIRLATNRRSEIEALEQASAAGLSPEALFDLLTETGPAQ